MAKSYKHLTHDQRCQIYTLKERSDSLADIARILGVHRSTITRELERNSGTRDYDYEKAHRKAQNRRKQSHCLKMTSKMILVIEEKIKIDWSPEQIAGWLKKQGCEYVSYETIVSVL